MAGATPRFFESPEEMRAWLQKHHADASELLIGFHKAHTGRPTLTWPQSVAEALCFGWIDGVRKSLGPDSYTIRFTPRRPGSVWSRVNFERYAALKAGGAMTEAGDAAFELGKDNPSNYSSDSDVRELPADRLDALLERMPGPAPPPLRITDCNLAAGSAS